MVSVIMPLFNGERYLGEAIDSVLGQSFRGFELIVVDDGSTDNSRAVAEAAAGGDTRVRYLHQANQGVTIARNNGIAHSVGELIAFLDQDDRWAVHALERQVRAHAEYPGIGYSVAQQVCFLQPGAGVPDWFRLQRLGEPAVAYLPGTLVIKRSALDRVGLFDPRYPISSDADWFARARDMGIEEHVVPEVILERRIHGENQSRLAPQIHGELFDVLRESLRRKRAARGAGRD